MFFRRKKKKKEGPNIEQYRQFLLEWIDVLPKPQRKMLRGVFALAHTNVREIMVPLSEIMAVHISTSIGEFRKIVRDTGYSFVPVYEERIDRLTGVVSVMNILYAECETDDLGSYVRSAYYIPETKVIGELLEELRTAEEHIAIVIDEHGGCVGIVTLENILEQIVGEISYESALDQRIEETGEMSWVIDAKTNIDHVNETLRTDIPKEQYDTIGGFLLKMIGHLPKQGEKIEYKGKEFSVAEVTDYGISLVHVNSVKPMLPSSKGSRRSKKKQKIKSLPSELESST